MKISYLKRTTVIGKKKKNHKVQSILEFRDVVFLLRSSTLSTCTINLVVQQIDEHNDVTWLHVHVDNLFITYDRFDRSFNWHARKVVYSLSGVNINKITIIMHVFKYSRYGRLTTLSPRSVE